ARGRAPQRQRERHRGGWLLLVPALPLAAFTLLLAPHYPPTHDLVRDPFLHSIYFTVFLYGYWMGADSGIWRELERLRRVSLALAVAVVAAYIASRTLGAGRVPDEVNAVLRSLYLWAAVATLLGHGHRHLNRPWPWLRWANASVYPWYMLHQTLIVLAIVRLAPLALGPVLEPALILAATLGGCWLLNDALIRRVR
ncbi:acyltransferase family protein, partial [Variovorax sp. CT11-76]